MITLQALAKSSLASRGWYVHPSEGRLAAYDGKYFHGVIPGCGAAPSSGSSGPLRRITFMVAFWEDIEVRPFGSDGLPGSSRPVPDPAEILEAGGREYTWHQALALPLQTPEDTTTKAPELTEVRLPSNSPVWVKLNGDRIPDGIALPDIGTCFQI